MTGSNAKIFTGAGYLFDGFELIFKPGLKRFVIIPLLLNTLLFIGLFLLSRHFFGEFNQWIENHLPWWLKWIGNLLWLIFFIGFFLIMLYTFVTIANFVCAPFNSLLSEKVEVYLTGKAPPKQSWAQIIKDLPRMLGRQIAILVYYLPRAVLLLILFFIPIVQIIAAPLWFLFNAWMMSIQHIDYPMDNNRIAFATLRQHLRQKRMLTLSFGSGILIMSMIPILNFIVIPAAVAGATKFWVEEYRK